MKETTTLIYQKQMYFEYCSYKYHCNFQYCYFSYVNVLLIIYFISKFKWQNSYAVLFNAKSNTYALALTPLFNFFEIWEWKKFYIEELFPHLIYIHIKLLLHEKQTFWIVFLFRINLHNKSNIWEYLYEAALHLKSQKSIPIKINNWQYIEVWKIFITYIYIVTTNLFNHK